MTTVPRVLLLVSLVGAGAVSAAAQPRDQDGKFDMLRREWTETFERVAGAVVVPWGDAARIPVTVTYASDPNSLKKQKQVIGHIGLDDDFGALTKLFK